MTLMICNLFKLQRSKMTSVQIKVMTIAQMTMGNKSILTILK
jgi:hypothetical protein